jgi:hypothetical protein
MAIVGSLLWMKAKVRSGIAIWRRVARWYVRIKTDLGDSNTILVTVQNGMHLLIVLQPRIVYQAMVVILAKLAIALVAATFAIAAAEMAREPRGWHLGVLAMDEATRMDDAPHENGQPHRCRLQDVQNRLITRKRVVCAQTSGELGKAVDNANRDSQQASVERPDQIFPASNLVRGQTSDPFCLELISVKFDDQAQE